jgi:translocator protein
MANSTKITPFWKLVITIAICESVGIISAILSNATNNNWFSAIQKPRWNPPSYLFAPVWAMLYLLMGISLWLVWMSDTPYFKKSNAICTFFFQLFFNFLWSILFFKFHLINVALLNILVMLITITATIVTFSAISKKASLILLPYIAWVSFATVLNFKIWILN